eukprot:5232584-Alexandrium_andersonii.AAC.1
MESKAHAAVGVVYRNARRARILLVRGLHPVGEVKVVRLGHLSDEIGVVHVHLPVGLLHALAGNA